MATDPFMRPFLGSMIFLLGSLINSIVLVFIISVNQDFLFQSNFPYINNYLLVASAMVTPVLLLFLFVFFNFDSIKNPYVLLLVVGSLAGISIYTSYSTYKLAINPDIDLCVKNFIAAKQVKNPKYDPKLESISNHITKSFENIKGKAFASFLIVVIASIPLFFVTILQPFVKSDDDDKQKKND